MTGKKQNVDAAAFCFFKSGGEIRISVCVWSDLCDVVHLNDKGTISVAAIVSCLYQFMEMLRPSLCGGVREEADPVTLQGAALHFHQIFFCCISKGTLHIEIYSRIAVGVFRNDFRRSDKSCVQLP